MNCINCGAEVSAKFCPECGQTNPVKKVSFKNMWVDFQSRIYGFDGMFPRTLLDLTMRPGVVAQSYINGNRVKYYGPVGYFFLMVTVFLLLLSILDVSFYDLMVRSSPMTEIKENSGMEKFMMIFSAWLTDNMRIFSFLIIPITVLMSQVWFRKSGFNFLEHSVMVFYIHGHVYWISILSMFIFKFTGYNPLRSTQPFAALVLYGIGYSRLIIYQTKVRAFIKGIGVYLTGMIIFLILFIIAGAFYMQSHPEYLELIRPKNN